MVRKRNANNKDLNTTTDLIDVSNSAPNGKKKKKKKTRWGRIVLMIFLAFVLIGLIGAVLVAGWVFGLAAELPEITAEDLAMAQNSFVYDADGNLLGTLHAGENRTTLELNEFPDFLVDAVIATEDIRFYDHFGVDIRSVGRAVVQVAKDSLAAGEVTFSQGASTITMQLIRNVVADTEKTMDRKVKEALLAVEFEKMYDKNEILYYYMNEIYLGKNVYGFQSAAIAYFDKEVSQLSLEEAALLVGLLRNPTYYSPYSQPERAKLVRDTVLLNLINYDEEKYGVTARTAMQRELVVVDGEVNTGSDYSHPWFVDYVLTEAEGILADLDRPSEQLFSGGLQIYTTMRPHVQTVMEEAYADPENFSASERLPEYTEPVQSGMAVIDPYTGEIAGLVGGREYTAKRGYSRATSLARQPGSSIKPIIAYGPAVDMGYGPGYVIDDAPMTGGYTPNNSDRTFQGRITMRSAIQGSRNVAAVKMLRTIGAENGWRYAVRSGLPLTEDDMNLAAALGGISRGVSPLQMAGAFAVYANNGIYTEPYSVSRIVDARGEVIYTANPTIDQVVTEQTAYLITDMLQSAVSGGTGTAAKVSGYRTAGKTGTVELPSEDPDYRGRSGNKDVWFCGYTTQYAAAVWVGYDNKWDDEDNLLYLSSAQFGGGTPARLFNTVMSGIMQGEDSVTGTSFDRPVGVTSVTLDSKSGLLVGDLTPAEYQKGELVNAAHVPGERSNIWEVVEICLDSQHKATEYCPNRTTTVRIKLEEGQTVSTSVRDYELYSPATVCTWHVSPQTDMQSVYICTHPDHGTNRVLANISSDGQSGCPTEYVALRYYSPGSLPTSYCTIEAHAITSGSNTNSGGPNSGPNQSNDDGLFPDIGNILDGGGTSGGGSDLLPNTGGGSGYAPTMHTPYGVSVSSSNTGCMLSWSANNDTSSTLYVVEKITDNDESTRLKLNIQGRTSFEDSDVEAGHSYTYRVYAYNAEYNVTSDWSSSVTYYAY